MAFLKRRLEIEVTLSNRACGLFAPILVAGALAYGQSEAIDTQTMSRNGMSGMNMPGMDMSNMADAQMKNMNLAGSFLMNLSSGTSVNPAAWQMPMIMIPAGSWNTMFMGQAFIVETQQSGPRGGGKLYSPNWFMANAEHSLGDKGAFQLQFMFSLDPATITDRRYPLLFQTGESAYGKPIVDGQHPHDLIMALNLQYSRELNKNTLLELSFGPVGDPALGPVAYPHRASAAELPQATLGHHWEDSTHIANEVLTAGVAYKKVKLEASGFYGREPDENRWNIDYGPINSWSTRFWYFPTRNWAAQVSVGRLARPEQLQAGDVVRSTASVEYTKPLPGGSWSSTFVWGRNHSTATHHNTAAYTLETLVPVHRRNFVTARAELVDKDELFANQPEVEEQLSRTVGSTSRIGAYTVGYTRDVSIFSHLQTGIGGNVQLYTLPSAIKPFYGDHPIGANVFVRLRLRARE